MPTLSERLARSLAERYSIARQVGEGGMATVFLVVFCVMLFVEGESLRDRLDREGQLPVADAVRIASDIASAFDYAHRQGSGGDLRLTEGGMSLGTSILHRTTTGRRARTAASS